eukprot:175274_1
MSSIAPTMNPTESPAKRAPTRTWGMFPTTQPTTFPTSILSINPTYNPTIKPVIHPTTEPTSVVPTQMMIRTNHPSFALLYITTIKPVIHPTTEPTSVVPTQMMIRTNHPSFALLYITTTRAQYIASTIEVTNPVGEEQEETEYEFVEIMIFASAISLCFCMISFFAYLTFKRKEHERQKKRETSPRYHRVDAYERTNVLNDENPSELELFKSPNHDQEIANVMDNVHVDYESDNSGNTDFYNSYGESYDIKNTFKNHLASDNNNKSLFSSVLQSFKFDDVDWKTQIFGCEECDQECDDPIAGCMQLKRLV